MLFFACIALLAVFASAEKGHLKLDFDVSKNANALGKRSGGSAEISLDVMPLYYQVLLNVGSNHAPINVVLDTGSSDLWIMESDVDCSLLDANGHPVCSLDGTFDPSASTTFKEMSNAPVFNITYDDGTYAVGYYGIDSVAIGAVSVPQCTFGVVKRTGSQYGVFGIGLPANEVGNAATPNYNGTGFIFPNFPSLLKSNGVTYKNVYSLYLNSEDATTGSVLFGAVDHKKYSGTLQTVPLVNPYPNFYPMPTEFQIVLSSVTVQGPQDSVLLSNSPVQALLDSGTAITQLPAGMVKTVSDMMSGSYDATVGFYQVSCDYVTDIDSMLFNFSGASISVPFSDLVLIDGSSCFLALTPVEMDPVSYGPFAILGENFLRHAYAVFDLDDYEISLAQVKYDSSEDIEVVISTIPSAVQAAAYSATSLASSIAVGPVSTGIIQTGPAPGSDSSEVPMSSVASPSDSSGVSFATSVSDTGSASIEPSQTEKIFSTSAESGASSATSEAIIVSSVSASASLGSSAGSSFTDVSSAIGPYGNGSTTSPQDTASSATGQITISSAVSAASSLGNLISTSLVDVVLASTVIVPCENGLSSTTSVSLSTSTSTSIVNVVLVSTDIVPCGSGSTATASASSFSSIAKSFARTGSEFTGVSHTGNASASTLQTVASSTAPQTPSAVPVVTTISSSGMKSVSLTKIVLYSAVCAGLVAYF